MPDRSLTYSRAGVFPQALPTHLKELSHCCGVLSGVRMALSAPIWSSFPQTQPKPLPLVQPLRV